MRDWNPMLEVDLEEHLFEALINNLKPGQKLSAAAVLAALDGEGEAEAFAEAEFLTLPLDISDLPRASGHGEAAVRLRQEAQLAASGDLLSGLEEGDPLRLYLEEIASIPVCGDIRLLAQELGEANLAQREEPELYSRILNLCLSRVVEIAKEYTGYGVLLTDLIQEGSMTLWRYLPRYAGDGDGFPLFRDCCIRYAMNKAVILQAHESGVGQKMRQALEDYRAVDERLLSELGRNPTLEEIAEELHMTLEEAEQVAQTLENARTVNRAKAAVEEKEETPDDDAAVEDTAYFQMRQRIAELISVLDEQEAALITLRYGLEGGLPLSPEETGRKLGMTPAEVVAAEAKALAKLRNH